MCETGVYNLKEYSDKELLDRCRKVIKNDDILEIGCEEFNEISNTSVEVKCLGFINPAHVIGIIGYGAQAIFFRHTDCSECEAKCGDDIALKTAKTAENILKGFYPSKRVEITQGKQVIAFKVSSEKGGIKKKNLEEDEIMSRRGLFSYFTKKSKLSALKTMDVFLDIEQKPARHRMDYSSLLPGKRKLILISLGDLGNPDGNLFDISDSKILAEIDIDKEKCDMCGICYKFCPTGALIEYTDLDDNGYRFKAGIDFISAYCVKCDLCLASCFRKALNYKSELDIARFVSEQKLPLMRRSKPIRKKPWLNR